MSATGYTPIQLYYSTTPSAQPLNTNLMSGELAINIYDKKLYALDNTGTVFLLASAAGATGTVSSVNVSGGTTGLTTSGGPITTSGTISLAGVLVGANGGTGVNNGSSTITIGGNITFSGAYSFTGTLSNNTSVTFPTTGTLATLAGSETLTNKTISGSSNTLSNIGNSSLTNSSITINGSSVSLGGSVTVTSSTTNSLTFNNGGSGAASGTAFDGSTAYTISYNTIGASPLAGSTSITTLGTITTGVWNGTAIGNSYLANSSITINGNSVSLGGSTTVTATATNALTIGTGLSGTSYNGSTAVTIAIDSTVATLSGSQTLTNKTISGASNTLTNIGNSSLTNSSITVNGSSISLGGSATVTATTTNALTIGTGLSGTSFNGSGAVTIAIDSTVATLTGAQTLTNKRIDPRVSSTASASSVTPTIASYDEYAFTALAATLTINAPVGTPVDGDKLIFRILDNGTPQTLSWNGTYTVIGVTLPTTTTANKTTYVGCIYNANNTRWDVVAVTTQA